VEEKRTRFPLSFFFFLLFSPNLTMSFFLSTYEGVVKYGNRLQGLEKVLEAKYQTAQQEKEQMEAERKRRLEEAEDLAAAREREGGMMEVETLMEGDAISASSVPIPSSTYSPSSRPADSSVELVDVVAMDTTTGELVLREQVVQEPTTSSSSSSARTREGETKGEEMDSVSSGFEPNTEVEEERAEVQTTGEESVSSFSGVPTPDSAASLPSSHIPQPFVTMAAGDVVVLPPTGDPPAEVLRFLFLLPFFFSTPSNFVLFSNENVVDHSQRTQRQVNDEDSQIPTLNRNQALPPLFLSFPFLRLPPLVLSFPLALPLPRLLSPFLLHHIEGSV
jgi:hypothetical protein